MGISSSGGAVEERDEQLFLLVFIRVTYTEQDPEIYLIPMNRLPNERLQALSDRHPLATVTGLFLEVEGVLCDPIYLEEFRAPPLRADEQPCQGARYKRLKVRRYSRWWRCLAVHPDNPHSICRAPVVTKT